MMARTCGVKAKAAPRGLGQKETAEAFKAAMRRRGERLLTRRSGIEFGRREERPEELTHEGDGPWSL